ncbi:BPL-N domain-containing protein [Balneatrix alpica]|uniref:BPL-N domain-containing protein n=2 Tax=Balneatrix alpica TaxID=75684 RepID=A0ABV5ZCE6_9GAMM
MGMIVRLGSMLLSLLVSMESMAVVSAGSAPYALIYNGPTADEASTEAISAVVQQLGLPIRYISELETLPSLLQEAKVFVIGGTDDDVEPLLQRFTPTLRATLRSYLQDGGRFLGICGGAYLASLGWQEEERFVEALAIVPALSASYDEDFEAKIYPVTWQGEARQMYYQAGPSFTLEASADRVTKLAYYQDQQLAALLSSYGRGKVAVSGPHPEAPASWRHEAYNGEQMDNNIDLALQLLQVLLADQPVLQSATE